MSDQSAHGPGPDTRSSRFAVADLLIDTGTRIVSRNGQSIELPRLSYEFLLALVRAAPNVLDQDTLIEQVWPGRVVSPETVTQRVRLLRRALGDDAQEPTYIGLARGQGYRLLAPVERLEPEPGPAGGLSPEEDLPVPVNDAPHPRRPSLIALGTVAVVAGAIVVLLWWQATTSVQNAMAAGRVAVQPFDVLTDDSAGRRFSAGLDGNLRRALAAAGIEAAAAIHPADQGEDQPMPELVLEGSVDRDQDHTLVTVHVVHQRDRVILWSSQFQRDTREMIDLQSQIASQVAQVVRCGLASREPRPERVTTRVFALFMQSCYQMENSDDEGAIKLRELAQRLVADAPDLAMAHAMYATAAAWMGNTQAAQVLPAGPESYFATAHRAAERALEIDPNNGTAHFAMASATSGDPAHWSLRETYLRKVDRTDLSFSFALSSLTWLARATGRLSDAIDLQRQAAEMDPFSSFHAMVLVWLLANQGTLPEADVALTRAEALWPNARIVADYRRQIAMWYRPVDVAEEVLRSSAARLGATDGDTACINALLDARHGRPVDFGDLRRTCAGQVDPNFLPRVLGFVGDIDGAFQEMEQLDFDQFGTTILLFFPQMRAVRHDDRFMPLAQRIGLVDYWLSTDRWPDFCAEPDLPYDCREVAASLANTAAIGEQTPVDR
jgi:DNA-binding winged helix-turn-helix (wHTH) protein/TolB-like protein